MYGSARCDTDIGRRNTDNIYEFKNPEDDIEAFDSGGNDYLLKLLLKRVTRCNREKYRGRNEKDTDLQMMKNIRTTLNYIV